MAEAIPFDAFEGGEDRVLEAFGGEQRELVRTLISSFRVPEQWTLQFKQAWTQGTGVDFERDLFLAEKEMAALTLESNTRGGNVAPKIGSLRESAVSTADATVAKLAARIQERGWPALQPVSEVSGRFTPNFFTTHRPKIAFLGFYMILARKLAATVNNPESVREDYTRLETLWSVLSLKAHRYMNWFASKDKPIIPNAHIDYPMLYEQFLASFYYTPDRIPELWNAPGAKKLKQSFLEASRKWTPRAVEPVPGGLFLAGPDEGAPLLVSPILAEDPDPEVNRASQQGVINFAGFIAAHGLGIPAPQPPPPNFDDYSRLPSETSRLEYLSSAAALEPTRGLSNLAAGPARTVSDFGAPASLFAASTSPVRVPSGPSLSMFDLFPTPRVESRSPFRAESFGMPVRRESSILRQQETSFNDLLTRMEAPPSRTPSKRSTRALSQFELEEHKEDEENVAKRQKGPTLGLKMAVGVSAEELHQAGKERVLRVQLDIAMSPEARMALLTRATEDIQWATSLRENWEAAAGIDFDVAIYYACRETARIDSSVNAKADAATKDSVRMQLIRDVITQIAYATRAAAKRGWTAPAAFYNRYSSNFLNIHLGLFPFLLLEQHLIERVRHAIKDDDKETYTTLEALRSIFWRTRALKEIGTKVVRRVHGSNSNEHRKILAAYFDLAELSTAELKRAMEAETAEREAQFHEEPMDTGALLEAVHKQEEHQAQAREASRARSKAVRDPLTIEETAAQDWAQSRADALQRQADAREAKRWEVQASRKARVAQMTPAEREELRQARRVKAEAEREAARLRIDEAMAQALESEPRPAQRVDMNMLWDSLQLESLAESQPPKNNLDALLGAVEMDESEGGLELGKRSSPEEETRQAKKPKLKVGQPMKAAVVVDTCCNMGCRKPVGTSPSLCTHCRNKDDAIYCSAACRASDAAQHKALCMLHVNYSA